MIQRIDIRPKYEEKPIDKDVLIEQLQKKVKEQEDELSKRLRKIDQYIRMTA